VSSVAARARSILEHGHVRRPSLGLHLGPDGLAERLGVRSGGVVIVEVPRSGPAHEAGALRGDVLVAVGARPVLSADDVVEALDLHEPGETVHLTVRRPVNRAAAEELAPGAVYKEVDLLVCLGEEAGRR